MCIYIYIYIYIYICIQEGKTNFFERRVGEYQKANVLGSCKEKDGDGDSKEGESSRGGLNMDADF
jgi:hypothetical protein